MLPPRTARALVVPALLLAGGCGRPDMGSLGPDQATEPERVSLDLEAVPYDRLGGGTLLFQRIRLFATGPEVLGLYRVDGTARTSATFLVHQPVYMPALAPDGERVAFLLEVGATSTGPGGFDVFVAGLDGRNVRRLSNDQGNVELAPSWTPDGSAAYVLSTGWPVADGRTGTAIVRQGASAAVGDRQALATLPTASGSAPCPGILGSDDTPVAVSAQGTILFVCRRASLYAVAPGGTPTLLYQAAPAMPGAQPAELASPDWSADGRRVAFLEIRRGTGADTTLVRALTAPTPGAIPADAAPTLLAAVPKSPGQAFAWAGTHSLCWLPNAVAFTAPETDRVAHVYVVPAEGGQAVAVTTAPDVFDRSVSCRG